jgi:3-oxoacyl-[acyl-carrier protein] reductase
MGIRPLENKAGVVIGGTRGIGQAIALRMASLGMNLTILARKQEGLDATCQKIEAQGVKFLGIRADITDYAALGKAFAKTWEAFGRFDLLVNSAGTGVMTPFEDLTRDDIDDTIDINLKGTIYSVRQSVPFFERSGGGNILNISSMSAIRGIPDPVNCNGIYTATKFAINGFTECMQKYLLKYNVRVTALCPGSTATSWWTRWTHSFGTDAMLPPDTLADIAEMIVTAPEKVLFKQLQVLPTVEIDNF